MAIKADHFVWRYHELIIVIILIKVDIREIKSHVYAKRQT